MNIPGVYVNCVVLVLIAFVSRARLRSSRCQRSTSEEVNHHQRLHQQRIGEGAINKERLNYSMRGLCLVTVPVDGTHDMLVSCLNARVALKPLVTTMLHLAELDGTCT